MSGLLILAIDGVDGVWSVITGYTLRLLSRSGRWIIRGGPFGATAPGIIFCVIVSVVLAGQILKLVLLSLSEVHSQTLSVALFSCLLLTALFAWCEMRLRKWKVGGASLLKVGIFRGLGWGCLLQAFLLGLVWITTSWQSSSDLTLGLYGSLVCAWLCFVVSTLVDTRSSKKKGKNKKKRRVP